jgi:uncharacterized protein (DUF1778 family)
MQMGHAIVFVTVTGEDDDMALRRQPEIEKPPARKRRSEERSIRRASDSEANVLASSVSKSTRRRRSTSTDVITLSERGAVAFVDAIENAPDPNPRLRAAAREYKKLIGR